MRDGVGANQSSEVWFDHEPVGHPFNLARVEDDRQMPVGGEKQSWQPVPSLLVFWAGGTDLSMVVLLTGFSVFQNGLAGQNVNLIAWF